MNLIKRLILGVYVVLGAIGLPEVKVIEKMISPLSRETAKSDGSGNASGRCHRT
jgi:hypothetical protein